MIDRLAYKLSTYVRLTDLDRRMLGDAMGPLLDIPARTNIRDTADDPQAIIVILDGWACRSRHLADGRHQIVSLLLPGDLCDLHAFLTQSLDHPISTLTSVSCGRISGRTRQELTARSNALKQAFQREALAAAALQREWTVSLGYRSGIERLAHLFCELDVRLGAVGLAQSNTYSLPLTQYDLAHVVGQTSVHINRTLQELRGQGLITFRSRRLTIFEPDRLAALAHFDPTYLHFTNGSALIDRPYFPSPKVTQGNR